MRDPLGRFPGYGEALLGLATARGGAGWWCSPASGVVRAGLCYGLRYLAQKNQEADEVLTGLRNEGRTGWRRVAGGARWRGTVVELQASGLPGSTPGRAVRVKRGLGWSGGCRRHGNRGGRATYRRCVPSEIPGAA